MRGQQRVCLAWTAYGRNLAEVDLSNPFDVRQQIASDLIKNPILHQRIKHIEVRNYFVLSVRRQAILMSCIFRQMISKKLKAISIELLSFFINWTSNFYGKV
jgi:hypothetical protein